MERVFWVKNGDLEEVNHWLQKGGKIKMIQAVSETIAAYGYRGYDGDKESISSRWSNSETHGNYVGDIYAYVVIEF